MNDEEMLIDLPNAPVLFNLVKAIKIIEVAWNIKKNKAHANNEPYIDVVIIHHQQDDYYLLVRQCVNIVGAGTKHKVSVGCGALSCKFNILMNSEESPLTGGEFYIKKEVAENFKDEADAIFINESIKRFINHTIRLGAQQHTDDQSFIAALEKNMLSRLTDEIPNGLIVKET